MKFHMYQDHIREWRWRLKARNGRIVAISGEGYHNKSDCRDAINLIKKEAPNAPIVEED